MVARRGFCDDGDDDGLGVFMRPPKRRFTFSNVVRDVMKGHSLGEISALLEPLLRKVVREEVERVVLHSLPPMTRASHNQIESARGRRLQLDFVTKMPSTIFTNSKIEPEDGSPVTVVLLDAATKTKVSSGPLSLCKIEIVVLDGDFGADEQENWTEEEFNAKIVRERVGKRPLVAGEVNVTLRDGVGIAGDIVFTDNSSWIRSRKFRLGARVIQRTSSEVTIREARSEAFMVKDHRGELYKKHYPPSSADEVWRLDRIAKDGAFHKRLAHHEILTVKDFLRSYVTDQSGLRNILGNGVSSRIWETIVDHALTCALDEDELYTYYGSVQRVWLLFDSVYRVLAATFDGQNFLALDKLNLSQKLALEDTKRQAYKNIGDLVLVDRRAIMGPSRPLIAQQAETAIGPDLNLQQLDLLGPHQDQADMRIAFNYSPTTAPYAFEAGSSHQFQVSLPQTGFFTPSLRNSFRMREMPVPYKSEIGWSPGTLQASLLAGSDLGTDEPPFLQLPTWNTTLGQGNGLFLATNGDSQFGFLSRIGRTRIWWCKLRACLKFDCIRRNVARKRLPHAGY